MDEVFGAEENFIANFIWKKKSTSTNVRGTQLSSLTDYVVCYGKTKEAKLNPRVRLKETRYYPYDDEEGKYRTTIIEKKHAGSYERESMRFPIMGILPREGKRWQIGKEKARELEEKNRFIVDNGAIKLKIYDFEDKDTLSANPNLLDQYGTTDTAAKMVNEEILGKPELFDNPKPIELVEHLINFPPLTNPLSFSTPSQAQVQPLMPSLPSTRKTAAIADSSLLSVKIMLTRSLRSVSAG